MTYHVQIILKGILDMGGHLWAIIKGKIIMYDIKFGISKSFKVLTGLGIHMAQKRKKIEEKVKKQLVFHCVAV